MKPLLTSIELFRIATVLVSFSLLSLSLIEVVDEFTRLAAGERVKLHHLLQVLSAGRILLLEKSCAHCEVCAHVTWILSNYLLSQRQRRLAVLYLGSALDAFPLFVNRQRS